MNAYRFPSLRIRVALKFTYFISHFISNKILVFWYSGEALLSERRLKISASVCFPPLVPHLHLVFLQISAGAKRGKLWRCLWRTEMRWLMTLWRVTGIMKNALLRKLWGRCLSQESNMVFLLVRRVFPNINRHALVFNFLCWSCYLWS